MLNDQRLTEEVLTELLYTAMYVPDHLVHPFLVLSETLAKELDPEAIRRSQEYALYRHEQTSHQHN